MDKSKNGDKRSVLVDSRLLPVLSMAYEKAGSPDSYLFPGRKGRPLNIRKPFEEARKAAGL